MKKGLIYAFKFFYDDGSIELAGGRSSKPEFLYGSLDGLVSWNEYDKIATSNLSVHELLTYAAGVFKNKWKKSFYRIEIVNTETNEVIDFVDCKE